MHRAVVERLEFWKHNAQLLNEIVYGIRVVRDSVREVDDVFSQRGSTHAWPGLRLQRLEAPKGHIGLVTHGLVVALCDYL